ncbi:MAG: TetR family transcriptional regulator [Chloroflexi bacterium]|nr:MAG: TetR family transcriptional regulator [Chloroflexota bacterium]
MRTLAIQRKAVKRSRGADAPRRASRRGKGRAPLSKEQILRAATLVADRDGLGAVTMRRLGQELGVEAMSLYHHVTNKEEVVAGMLELLVSELPAPDAGDWKATIRARALAAREHLRPHAWAFRLIANAEGVNLMKHHDAVVASLRAGGLSRQLTHTAMHVLGNRTFGFSEDLFLGDDHGHRRVQEILREVRQGKYPAIAEALQGVHHDDDLEFIFALDLILDGLERARDGEARDARTTSPVRDA